MGPRRVVRFSLLLCIVVALVIFYGIQPAEDFSLKEDLVEEGNEKESLLIVNSSFVEPFAVKEFFASRKDNYTFSTLGEYLFVDFIQPEKRNGNFNVLIWHGKPLQRRHIMNFGKEKHDPFENCSVNNCILTYDQDNISNADAVVFLLHRMKTSEDLPLTSLRPQGQKWIFLTDESPYHTFLKASNKNYALFNGYFNWSMSYRMESDVPVPYGRTLRLPLIDMALKEKVNISSLIPHFEEKRHDVLVAITISNCHGSSYRWKYIQELQEYIPVDVYGGCGSLKEKCPGHFSKDCPELDKYLFYLSFENARCNQYITEKTFHNAITKGAIPIILGPQRSDLKLILPPKSYLHVDNFARPSDLAMFIIFLNRTNEYLDYHEWRRTFFVANENGYFQTASVHYCRICEALNYNNNEKKTYDDLGSYLNVSLNCQLEK